MNWIQDFYPALPRKYVEWRTDTIDGVLLPIGFEKYSTCKDCPILLTDKKPNALFVMKHPEVFISQLICTLTEMYAPNFLQIYYFDLQLRVLPSFLANYSPVTGKFISPNRNSSVRSSFMRSPLPHLGFYNESSVWTENKYFLEMLNLYMIQDGTNIYGKSLSEILTELLQRHRENAENSSWKDLVLDVQWYADKVVPKYNSVARKVVIINSLDIISREDPDYFSTIIQLLNSADMCGYHFLLFAESNPSHKYDSIARCCGHIIEDASLDPATNTRYTPVEYCEHENRELQSIDPDKSVSKWIYPDINAQNILNHMHRISRMQASYGRKYVCQSDNW